MNGPRIANRSLGRDDGLCHDLASIDTLPADLGTPADEGVVTIGLDIEQPQQILNGVSHASPLSHSHRKPAVVLKTVWEYHAR
jgi:hypothetical protein